MKDAHSRFLIKTLWLVGVIALLGVLGGLTLGAPARANAQPRLSAIESLLNADGTLKRDTGASGAVDLRGWNVARDAKRGPVLSRANAAAPNAATTAASNWTALPNGGLNGAVYAVVFFGNSIVVGGDFTKTADGSITLNHIAAWDGSSWSALPNNGLNDSVYALAVYGNKLYVGGGFSDAVNSVGSGGLKNLAMFDGSSWHAIPVGSSNGVSASVLALAVWANDLYIGGAFLKAGDSTIVLNRMAVYDGNILSALPSGGVNGNVSALLDGGFDLYVGGDFTGTANSLTALNRVAAYDGSWHPMDNGLNNTVYALAQFNGATYAGGAFTKSGNNSITLNHLAQYDGSHWVGVNGSGLNDTVNVLTAAGSTLYAGGAFTATGDTNTTLNHIGSFNGTSWSVLPNNGLDDVVRAVLPVGDGIIAAGDFVKTKDNAVTLNHVGLVDFAVQSGPTYVVDSSADYDDGFCDSAGQGIVNDDCTVREAINAANAHGGADTITFSGDKTITLNSSLPTISDTLTITGAAQRIILDGNNAHRILRVSSSGNLTLTHLTIRNGATDTLLAWGKSGAGVYNDGGTLKVYSSTFENNKADNYGGAIFADGTTLVANSTFEGNTVPNDAGLGGAITNVKPLTVKNSTLSGGAANTAGGIYNQSTLTLLNTIIANSSGGDCTNNGTIVNGSAKNNLIESTGTDACGLTNGSNGNKIGIDPNLGSLADNGDTTQTFALPTGSAAIDAGDNTTCGDSDVNNKDQRGVTRPIDGNGDALAICDIGSYEAPVLPPTNTPTRTATPTKTGTPTRTPTRTASPTVNPCPNKPAKPKLLTPANGSKVSVVIVKFDWSNVKCASSYSLVVVNTITKEVKAKTFTKSNGKLKITKHGSYSWSVLACDDAGCTESKKFKFTR